MVIAFLLLQNENRDFVTAVQFSVTYVDDWWFQVDTHRVFWLGQWWQVCWQIHFTFTPAFVCCLSC